MLWERERESMCSLGFIGFRLFMTLRQCGSGFAKFGLGLCNLGEQCVGVRIQGRHVMFLESANTKSSARSVSLDFGDFGDPGRAVLGLAYRLGGKGTLGFSKSPKITENHRLQSPKITEITEITDPNHRKSPKITDSFTDDVHMASPKPEP